MKTRKTWREKLEREQEPKVVNDPKSREKMLIPKSLDVDAPIRKVQRGKLVTVGQIRERLARDFQADFTCPLVTGIFIPAYCGNGGRRPLLKKGNPVA